MRPILLVLLVSLPCFADPQPPYYVGTTDSDPTNFAQCPYFYDPILTSPGGSSNTLTVPTGATDSAPFGVTTLFNSAHHWTFTSTNTGVWAVDFAQSPLVQGALQHSSRAASGVETTSTTSGWKLLVVAADKVKGVAHSYLEIYSLDINSPLGASRQDVDLNPSPLPPGIISPWATAGSPPTSIEVTASNGIAFVTNECEGNGGRGSLDVIDIATHTLKNRYRMDKAPVGMAVAGASSQYLLVLNEGAADLAVGSGHGYVGSTNDHNPADIGSYVGGLYVYSIDYTNEALTLLNAVNPGCAPVRVVVDGNGRAWVTARWSNEVTVFNISDLVSNPSQSRRARFVVGPEPVGLKMLAGGTLVAVANSFRTSTTGEICSMFPTTIYPDCNHPTYPAPSMMVFRVSDITLGFSGSTTRQNPGYCAVSGTLHGYGDFPRNFALDSSRLYLTLWGASSLEYFDTSSLCP